MQCTNHGSSQGPSSRGFLPRYIAFSGRVSGALTASLLLAVLERLFHSYSSPPSPTGQAQSLPQPQTGSKQRERDKEILTLSSST